MNSKKAIISFYLFLCSVFIFSQPGSLDGIWAKMYWQKSTDRTTYQFDYFCKQYTWGIGKKDKYGLQDLEIDIKGDYFTDYDSYGNCIILNISEIDEQAERVLLFQKSGKKFYPLIITFISDDIIQIVAEGSNYPSTYYRISGPARIPVQNAVVNTPQVRCLTESSFAGETWGYLNAGDKVLIKDISDEPFEIDGEAWYWYRVESEYLPDGWVYGKYLDIEE